MARDGEIERIEEPRPARMKPPHGDQHSAVTGPRNPCLSMRKMSMRWSNVLPGRNRSRMAPMVTDPGVLGFLPFRKVSVNFKLSRDPSVTNLNQWRCRRRPGRRLKFNQGMPLSHNIRVG
jgi:hypothetical protein